jgi:pyruvate dehydrogenase E2 component (dihydrolipoamide acetyltransferase)
MAVPVEVPTFGLQAPSVRVAEWYLPDGVVVLRGEALCRIETNDVAIDLEAEGEGVLRHRLEAGFDRPAGDVLGVILASGERMPEMPPVEGAPPPEPAETRRGPTDDEWRGSDWAMRYWPDGDAKPAPGDEPGNASGPVQETPRAFALVPFPRRQGAGAASWDPAPGDSVDFASALFGPARPRDAFATNLKADEALDAELDNEGAPPVTVADAGDAPDRVDAAEPGPEENPRIVAFPPVGPRRRALTMRSAIDLTEAHKLRAQLGREWQGDAPGNEDVVVRAAGRALAELGADGSVTLRTFAGGHARSALLRDAGRVPFREAVAELHSGADAGEAEAACVVSLFEEVDEAEPLLTNGASFAFAIGGERTTVRWEGERAVPAATLTLTLSCDPDRVEPFEAARFLARVRELVESPYALLVA